MVALNPPNKSSEMQGLASSRWASAQSHQWVRPGAQGKDFQEPAIHVARPDADPVNFQEPVPMIQPDGTPMDFCEQIGESAPLNNALLPAVDPALAFEEYRRYTKIIQRLHWKGRFLQAGYDQAITRIGRHPDEIAHDEMQFKLDFFECYMLIERALVHLLGVWGIQVHRELLNSVHNRFRSKNGGGPERYQLTHRYHANVLGALGNPQNPLFPIFGTGEIKRQLARAKELRNRWKNGLDDSGYAPAPLATYELDIILSTIKTGLDQGYAMAQEYLGIAPPSTSGLSNPVHWSQEEEDWNFMVDAMDWEAV